MGDNGTQAGVLIRTKLRVIFAAMVFDEVFLSLQFLGGSVSKNSIFHF